MKYDNPIPPVLNKFVNSLRPVLCKQRPNANCVADLEAVGNSVTLVVTEGDSKATVCVTIPLIEQCMVDPNKLGDVIDVITMQITEGLEMTPEEPKPKPFKKVVEYRHIQNLVDSLSFKFTLVEGTTLTICTALLPNGYIIGSGESACIDPNAYDQVLGEKYAKERAIADATKNLWEKEGYLLKVTGFTSDHFKIHTQ